jgi:coenzyme F420-reducing hydrogenase beta subunit
VEGGLQLQLNSETMMYEPSGSGGEAAASVCPSVQVDFEGLQKKLFPGEPFTSVGAVKSIMLAQSTNYERNLKASSGGIIKELLLEYLSRHEVDGAIALSHVEGLLFEPSLITRTEQVDMLPGSIYHNIPFDKALHLLGTNQGCYVLVAIPCQLEGIYNYIFKYRPELVERVYTAIGLICGWTYTHHSIKAICEFKGLDFDQIEAVAFRGGDPVGRLRIQLPRKKVEVNRRTDFDYIVAFDRSFNTPRCHLCVNHVNFLADIVVGDAWLSSTANSKSGASIVICRTKEAVEVMQTLEEKGRIRRAEATEAEIVESQGRRFTYGDSSYAYADYLEAIGEFCPDMIGPNRSAAKLSSRRSVKRFHRENTRRIHLQRQGKYRYLRWRKVAVDLGKYVYRYLRKLLLRSSRSLLGRRPEIPTSDLRDFR